MKHNVTLGISQRSTRLVIVKHVTIRLKCGCGTELLPRHYLWTNLAIRPTKFPAITVKFPHFCLLSRITHEVTFFPHFCKLNLSTFLYVGQLVPFRFTCTMLNAFFLPTPVKPNPEILRMCVSIAYQKERKSWETPELTPEEQR
jgi:hypothetical protein